MSTVLENPIVIDDATAKGSFLKALFSFDRFVTVPIVKFVFYIGTALILLLTIGGGLYMTLWRVYLAYEYYHAFSGLLSDIFYIIFQAVVAIVSCVMGILLLRLYCEFILAIFKINENLQAMRNRETSV